MMVKHPESRAERLKLRGLYLKKKNNEKAKEVRSNNFKRRTKEALKAKETEYELQRALANRRTDLDG